MKYLSPHISWDEAIHTNSRLQNEPNAEQIENMKQLAFNVFEPLRIHFQTPIFINSFFRSEAVNKAVKGSKNSQHMALNGAAMDITIKDNVITNEDLFNYIRDFLPYCQLINEYNFSWIHVSYEKGNNKKQVLEIN